MDDVITLSSDSENDSDLEIVGSYSNAMTAAAPLPLTAVRIDVDAVNVNIPMHYIDLTDPKWTLPVLKNRKRLNSTTMAVANVTEGYVANMKELETLPPDNCQIKKERTDKSQTPSKQNVQLQESSSETPPVSALQLDCDGQKSKQGCLDSQTQHQKQPDEERHCMPTVKLRRLPFLETNVTELKRSSCSIYLTKDCMQMSLQQRHPDRISETSECISNGPHTEPSLDESPPKMIDAVVRQKQEGNSNEFTSSLSDAKISQHPQSSAECSVLTSEKHITHEDKNDGFCSSLFIPSQTSPSSSQDKAQTSLQREVHYLNLEQLELVQADSRQNSDRSSPHSPTTHLNISEPFKLNPLSHTNSVSHNVMRQFNLTLTSKDATTENISELQSVEVNSDEASHSPDLVHGSSPCEFPLSESKTDMDMDDGSGTEINRWDLEIESPVSFLWQEGSDGEQVDKESRFDMDFRAASREDMHFVCPVTLGKIMPGPVQAPIDVEDDDFATAEVLCHPSLSLVYTTMSENYPEGTLQLLSDLLQPGYYPPRDITVHLLRGILLDLHCPYHLCVQAFNLLIRTQRHHMADKTTVPWDWELLTSVMANQDSTKRHRSEVVRMFLEYIVQTLEDDFQAKRSMSTRHHSIAMATLSCDKHFPHVRDVIKWLFSAIMNSTDDRENREKPRERDEQIRIVYIFQRMLSLALEVDHSPAINSAKLSQELFLMLIGDTPLRAHRMMLLESLQSKLLRCKLLEHLLDYACPLKVPLPMSLSLLLHFMKNCILAPDPTDGTERWQRWEELVHLLWMLLLSYNKAMKGYLCSSGTEQRSMAGSLVYKQDDMLSKPAVREAVETFLSRSEADLGQALPRHVEESLTYLQDYLLDVCQC